MQISEGKACMRTIVENSGFVKMFLNMTKRHFPLPFLSFLILISESMKALLAC